MSAASITLTARELTALVAPVLPHASRDWTLPLLASIRVRSAGPWVTAIATDRYRIGMQRVRPADAPEPGFDVAIPLGVLARIRTIFKATRAHDPALTLRQEGDVVRVEAADGLDGMVGARIEFRIPDNGKWPDIDKIVRDALAATPGTELVVPTFNHAHLADFTIGQPHHVAARVTPTDGANKPWLIRIGEDFVGLLMPVRLTAEESPALTGEWLSLVSASVLEAAVAA